MKSFLLSALSLALASISLHADPRSEGSLNQTPLRTTETLTGAEFLLLAQGDPSGNTRRVEESISIADFNALYSGSAEFSYFANPKASDYGAFGDGASHQAITAFATLGEAQAFYPRCLDLTEELDGLAIQKAIDTRRGVFLPAGIYRLSTTLELETQGQVVMGESGTRTILRWIADVDGMEIEEMTESTTTNFPSSSVGSNSWGKIENLLLQGPAGSTKKAFTNSQVESPTTWIGEGWRIDFCTVLDWDIGIYSSKAARYNSRSITIKNCDIGMELATGGSATNNCHVFLGLNVSECDIGLKLSGLNSGYFLLQDFAATRIGVQVTESHVDFVGGELESYTERFFDIDSSRVTIHGARFLGGTAIIPILVDNSSSVGIHNSRQAQAATTAPLAEIVDIRSSVFGTPSDNLNTATPGDLSTSKVKLSSGSVVYLTPLPWVVGPGPFALDSKHRGVLHWREAQSSANLNNDDLQAHILVDGDPVRVDAFKSNYFIEEVTATTYTTQGFEDVILMANTGARTLTLREMASANYRSNARIFRQIRVIDAAGTAGANAITINTSSTDTINGASSYLIDENWGSVTLGFKNDGKLYVIR